MTLKAPTTTEMHSAIGRHVFMVNPVSGDGKGALIAKALGPALDRIGLPASAYAIRMTTFPTDFAALRSLAAGAASLIAIGGDGTVSELAEPVLNAGTECALGVIPVGTGNDLARVTGTHRLLSRRGLEAVLHSLLQGRTMPLDVWRADDRYFTNYLSIGLDAAVSANFHLRRQLGLFPTGSVLGNKATYAMYAMGSLGRRIRGSRAELILADGSRAHLDLRGSTALILSNVPSYGGGTLPACGICCNDGLLQAVVIRSPWSLAGLFLVHGLLPWCKSAYAARLECLAVRRAILHLEQDEFLQTDGEPRLEMAGRSIVVERAGCVRVLRIAT